jgi:iron complex outermembrane receptor protein
MSCHPQIRASVRLALLVAAATLPAVNASAQEPETPADDSTMQEVVVTGSRILTPNLESPSPVQSITAENLESTGALNVQDVLLKNPTMGTPTLSRTNSAFLTSGAGVATVDLRRSTTTPSRLSSSNASMS